MTFKEFSQKKVAGVPVIYLAAAGVIILAIVAWKMKPSTPKEDAGETASDASAGGGLDAPDYSGLSTQGTVTVVQGTNQTVPDPVVKTNETWVKEGAEWLVKENKATGPAALTALSKFINGVDRSFDEQQLVDAVFKEKGAPPDGIAEGGNVGAKPAQKQFSVFPGTHTITGSSDSTYKQIATLYYGRGTPDDIDLLQGANTSIGKTLGPFAAGTKIVVPAFHDPKYVTMTAPTKWNVVAAKNGISEATLRVLNDNNNSWAFAALIPKGQRVRVA